MDVVGDGRRRVVVLGGGMGGLTAAYELSKTPQLREKYAVTVYQMGWRLGGRCASSRNKGNQRVEEHGLHVWFGFYRNAFGLLRETYAALNRPLGHPFRSVEQAFEGRSFAALGSSADAGGAWETSWPVTPGEPWDDSPINARDAVHQLTAWLHQHVQQWHSMPGSIREEAGLIAAPLNRAWHHFLDRLTAAPKHLAELADAAIHLDLESFRGAYRSAVAEVRAEVDHLEADRHRLHVLIDLGTAMLAGLLDPADGVFQHGDLGRIDHLEFRDWLRHHGAEELSLWTPPVRALYDLAFAYADGDPMKPSWAAGVATRALLRIALGYRGSVFYVPRAGFGEVVIQPLYELLAARGVSFQFFHRVERLLGSADGKQVARIELTRQAALTTSDAYVPTIPIQVSDKATPFEAWPDRPRWDQLVGGAALEERGVNFESRWCSESGEALTLAQGTDFDDVVLGVPLHAAREILAPFAEHAVLGPALAGSTPIPSIAVQLWLEAPLVVDPAGKAPHAVVGGPTPLDIATDMSQVIATEPWPGVSRPHAAHYLCAVAPLEGVYAPPDQVDVPVQAAARARERAETFLEHGAWAIWPGAGPRGTPFPWGTLFDPAHGTGPQRLDAQYIRANVDPTECCPSSFPGTISQRPTAGGTGVGNLYLAGDSVRTGLDTACVESAVMAGRQAARALTGIHFDVPGERFFAALPTDLAPASAPVTPSVFPAITIGTETGVPPTLPQYTSALGLGQVALRTPFQFHDCTAWAFTLPGDRGKLQALVDGRLNVPSGGALGFSVANSAVLFVWLHAEQGSSLGEPIGRAKDNEMSVAILVHYQAPGEPARYAFWMPYLAVDTALAMASGRETWGFQKEVGAIETPPDTGGLHCKTSALHFPKLSQTTDAVWGTLVEVLDAVPNPGLVAVTAVTDFLTTVASSIFGSAGEKHSAVVAGVPFDPALFGSMTSVPIVNLKQFRDAEDDTRACYLAVVQSSFQVTSFGGGGPILNPVQCVFTPAESHDFVGALLADDPLTGPSHTYALPGAWKVRFDFNVGPGKIIWRHS